MTTMTAVSAQDKILAVSSSLSEPTAVSSEDTPEKAAATAAKEIAESRSNPLSKDDDDDDDDDESAEEEQDQLKEESPHGDDESGEEADGDLEEDVSSSDEDSSSSSSDEDDDDEEEEERDGKNKNNNNNNNELSEYELLRLQRIERNRARLEQLGLLEDNIPKKKQDNKRRRSSVSQPPLEPLRQLPKREARNKVVFQQTLDMRTFRVSSKQSPNTQVQKRCGECIGCTRQDDCNTCVYCAERLRGRRTRFYRCLFKACRKRLIPNQDTKMEEKKDDSSSAPATQPPTPTPTPAHCEMCKQPNNQDLVCCTRCNLGYHSNCHVPKIHRLPLAGDQWLCKPCKQTISKNDKHKLKLASKNELVAVFPSENKQKRNTIKVKVLKPTTTCGLCHQASSDHKIMIQCKACDDHFHLFCQDPPLESKPVGRDFRTWRCNQCQANDKPLLEHHQKARPPSIRRTQMSLELFQGEHNDQCFMCFNGGQLVCCDFCPKVYHCQCHIPALPALPSNDNYWKCCECYASERTRMTRCGECKACLSTDCGKCQFCKDKPKFGGPGSLKKVCVQRDCPYLSLAETYIPGKIPGEICGPVRSNNTFKKKRAREEEETTTTTTKDDDPQDDDDDASEHMTYPQQDNNYNYNKRGKRKKPKDKPKRPLSAYNFFFKEERGRILEGLGDAKPHDKLGFESLAKVIGKRWQDLSTEDMAEYQKKAEASTVQYRKALTEWQANQTTSGLDTTPRNTITPQKTNRQKHNTPKRPQSAFLAYANSRRGKVKAQNPHVNNSELSQMLSVMWKNAPDNIKQEYRGDEAAGWAAYKKEAVESVTNISLPNHPNDQVDDDEKAPAKNKPKPIELQHDEPILVFLKIPKLKDSISVKIRKIINNASRNPLDSKIQDKACEHLRKFTDSKDYIQKIVLSGGIEMIADAMEQHPDKTIVQAEAYATLAEMVFLCPEIAAKLIHMGILDLILACMGNKKNNDKVQQMGCGVFRALSHSTDNMDIIMKSGGVSAVLSSMKENPKRLLVQREGCCKYLFVYGSYSYISLLIHFFS